MDRLIQVYNQMADRLREERIRLQEQNCFLEKIVQTSPTGILILDFDGAVSTANPAAATLLASSIEGLRGKRLTEMCTPLAEALNRLETGESRILSRSDQLNRFMAGFAEVARLPAPRRSPCDIRKILQETVLCMSGEAQKKGISWQWEAVEPYPMVALDRIQMEQVFINLLKNAIEAIEHDGIITLRIGAPSPRLPVTVEDNGCGMTAETQANLFVPFFSTKTHGQGIGLTMVKEILLQHGFDFSLESQPGGPTRFTIFFDISTQT